MVRATPARCCWHRLFWGVEACPACFAVVIDKLPFAPHTDPLIAARMQAAAGDEPFATSSCRPPRSPSGASAGDPPARRPRHRRVLDGGRHRGYGRVLASLPAGLPCSSR
jgi:hypothetical protein